MATKSKNQRKRVKLYLMAATTCLVMAGIWGFLATPDVALATKPDNPGGGGDDSGIVPVCVTLLGPAVYGDDGLTPYCNDKKLKVEAILTQEGWVALDPDTSSKQTGRGFFVDFGDALTGSGLESPLSSLFIENTDDLTDAGITHNEYLQFAILAGTVDLRSMEAGDIRTDATMQIRLELTYDDGAFGLLWITFNPDFERFECNGLGSDRIKITRGSGDNGRKAISWE